MPSFFGYILNELHYQTLHLFITKDIFYKVNVHYLKREKEGSQISTRVHILFLGALLNIFSKTCPISHLKAYILSRYDT